jgi:hypothetical protein
VPFILVTEVTDVTDFPGFRYMVFGLDYPIKSVTSVTFVGKKPGWYLNSTIPRKCYG